MNPMIHGGDSLQQHPQRQSCQTCLYRDHNDANSRDNCSRFARFVDHLIHETSKDCDYWSPDPSPL
jgi:hypothetical protein